MGILTISYQGYLTEEKLFKSFSQVFGDLNIKVERNKPLKDLIKTSKRFKVDIVIEDLKLLIEFDGYKHYQDFETIKRDFEKDKLIKDNLDLEKEWLFLRIPYFVQLDNLVLENLFNQHLKKFGLKLISNIDFPHGFVDKKALRPLSFSCIGLAKFLNQINNQFLFVRDNIFNTLTEIEKEYLRKIDVEKILRLLDF